MTDELRKLDAEVAEKVMGWTREVQDGGVEGFRDAAGKFHVVGPGFESFHNFWSPSTDLAAAWSVIDAMRANGYSVDIDDFTARTPNVWTVRFFKGDFADPDEYGSAEAEAPTFTEAVCLAALRSMEVKC